jgi:hypothetical protein
LKPAEQHEVLLASQAVVHGGELPGEGDRLTHERRLARDVMTSNTRSPAVGGQQRAEDPYRGGLARAVGAEDPDHAARRDAQVKPVERDGLAETLAQPLRDDRTFCGLAVHDTTRAKKL